MKSAPFHILRVGMAITFLWIGILILQNPEAWGRYLLPWARDFLLIPLKTAMIGTAIFDIVTGFLLLINRFTFWASALASFHLFLVLAVSGINPITIRDIGLLSGALALALSFFPHGFETKQHYS